MLGYGAGCTPLFLCTKNKLKNLLKSIDIIPKRVYNNKHREEEKEKNKCKALERR